MKNLLLIIISLASINAMAQNNRIKIGNQEIFLSGMNLAWINYANDPVNFNSQVFQKAVDEINAAGGNTIRLWLHTDGRSNPTFDKTGKVISINPVCIENIRKALDIAYAKGIMLDLCLWSFDMQRKEMDSIQKQRNKLLLTNTEYTKAYINNALVPMVKALKDHPGILCWEVFNEPEGMSNQFGWGNTEHVDMSDIQRVVNLVAGAVHREAPGKLVSSGAWTVVACSDADGFTNYYRDDRLKAIGSDPLGYLDFYMVHYYTINGIKLSPFRKPASHWKLDKPLVIGEFSAKGLTDETPVQTPEQLYNYAYENGYAGALSWTYSNHDGHGGLPNCAIALTMLKEKYPESIVIKK